MTSLLGLDRALTWLASHAGPSYSTFLETSTTRFRHSLLTRMRLLTSCCKGKGLPDHTRPKLPLPRQLLTPAVVQLRWIEVVVVVVVVVHRADIAWHST